MKGKQTTLPKPFVFVLMPFDQEFDDIYKFGIKGAAEDVGAYAERVDEQIYMEGILERIFNQISKADVIVADMSNRNPNVFYEVGYAHALGKIVLLLTQKADDIPFDLTHKQHIIYNKKIELLRKELGVKLQWAISASKLNENDFLNVELGLYLDKKPITYTDDLSKCQTIEISTESVVAKIEMSISNNSSRLFPPISHIYIYSKCNSFLRISTYFPGEYSPSNPIGETYSLNSLSEKLAWVLENDGKKDLAEEMRSVVRGGKANIPSNMIDCSFQEDLNPEFKYHYKLENNLPAIPPGALEIFPIFFAFRSPSSFTETILKFRLHTKERFYDYPIRLKNARVET